MEDDPPHTHHRRDDRREDSHDRPRDERREERRIYGPAAQPADRRNEPAHQQRPGYVDATRLSATSAACAAADSQHGYATAALAVGDFPAAHRAWQNAVHEQGAATYYSATAITHEIRAEAAATRLSPTGYQPLAKPTHDHAPTQSQARHRGPTQASGPRRTR